MIETEPVPNAVRPARRLRIGLLAAAIAASTNVVAVFPAAAQGDFAEEGGTLPDGTEYLMRFPADWNGTLIRDLDFVPGANNARNRYFVASGYAVLGTRRHRLRAFQYDPVREIANINLVHDRFLARFGEPRRVIQYGCSGGGHVALAVAESFPERVDGVIATAAHTPVWIMNTFLDGWFTLKALIAPELAIVDLPIAQSGGTSHDLEGPLTVAWRDAINDAQETPEGRARIALAFTVGQWPAWVNRLTAQPDLEDVPALEHSMYHAVLQNTANPGGEARVLFESAAHGQQLSWNTGVDYREFFENGNEFFKRAVHRLYEEAGVDLDADLARLNAFPRVAASPHALEFWKAPGRNATGRPQIPLFRMHEIGDYQVPTSLIQGYNTLIRTKGSDEMYRAAYVNGPGHCRFTAAESAAALEIMMRRLDTGRWESTDPDHLNELAATLDGSGSRFILYDRYRQGRYNRAWTPK